jgi:prophage antirepressor-like protein
MAMKENTRNVLAYLKENNGVNLTAADVADALGLEKRQVDGIFTSALQRKGYGVRVEQEIELPDSTHQKVKFLRLTDAGLNLDPDAEE